MAISRQSHSHVLKSKALIRRYRQGAGIVGKRSAMSSLCCNPGSSVYQFHMCTTAQGVTCFVDNEFKAVLASLTLIKQNTLISNVKQTIHNAKRGNLAQDRNYRYNPLAKPCASQPDIWELRWNLRGNLYRLYYSENGGRNPEFVALSFTRKITRKRTTTQIKYTQNQAISMAQSRFDRYQSIQWGHTGSNCKYCI